MGQQFMGLGYDIGAPETCFVKKNLWLLKIPKVSDDSVESLPPVRGSRPQLAFKEIEAQVPSETLYFPGKPDWKPINLSLYEIKRKNNRTKHPVFEWLKKIYDAQRGVYNLNVINSRVDADLYMYSSCGDVLEHWVFENAWPNNINFGELDHTDSNPVQVDITLRYERAYFLPT